MGRWGEPSRQKVSGLADENPVLGLSYCKWLTSRKSPSTPPREAGASPYPGVEVGVVPRKPAHPCKHPGCSGLTHGKYCDAHAGLEQTEARDYRSRRDPAINKRYDHAWRKTRNRYIATHPVCAHCQQAGRITPAAEVDHIIPLEHGGTHADTNLQALCKPCHSAKTARDGDRWRTQVYEYRF